MLVVALAILMVAGIVMVQPGADAASSSRGKGGHHGGARRTLSGVVEGNGTLQAGYKVRLYASRLVGRPRTTLLGSDITDGRGRFEIRFKLARAQPHRRSVFYVLAERHSAMLASAVGDVSRGGSVVVNERTTVAIATAFAQFVDGRRIEGDTFGMLNAVMMAANMADPATGLVGAVLANPPNGGETSTLATFDSLANIVASCVADDAGCDSLFALTTPAGTPPVTTVLQAIANMTKFPANEVTDLFALGAGGPFAPALAEAPTSWLLFLKFTGSMTSDYSSTNLMSGPGNVAFDRLGFAWINDNRGLERTAVVADGDLHGQPGEHVGIELRCGGRPVRDPVRSHGVDGPLRRALPGGRQPPDEGHRRRHERPMGQRRRWERHRVGLQLRPEPDDRHR